MSQEAKSPERSRKNKRRDLHPTGKLLKELRKASGYSQEEIRAVLGFRAASAISRLESGDFSPDVHRLKKLLNLLRPDEAQTVEIIEFFGYQSEDLNESESAIRVVRHHPEQHPLLNRLHSLFYLFVYQKDYPGVMRQIDEYRTHLLPLPEVLGPLETECRLILDNIYICWRFLARGMFEEKLADFEDAYRCAEQMMQLLKLTELRLQSIRLAVPGPALLYQFMMHAHLCMHSSIFKQLNYLLEHQPDALQIESLFRQLKDSSVSQTLNTLQLLQSILPQEELNEIYRMYLFMRREYLHIRACEADEHDQRKYDELLSASTVWLKSTPLPLKRMFEIHNNPKLWRSVCQQLYQELYAPGAAATKKWLDIQPYYQDVLKEHQHLPNWDGEASEVMRAMINTFLGLASLLGRVHHYEQACLFLDTFYLRLNVNQTHFNWHSTYALVEAFCYLKQTQFKTRAELSETAHEALSRMSYHLEQSLNHLENETDKKRMRKYQLLQEPVIYLILLDLDQYTNPPAAALRLRQEMLDSLQEELKDPSYGES